MQWLQNDGAGIIGSGFFDGVDAIVLHIDEAGGQGEIWLLVFGLSGGRHHAQRTTVEGAVGADNLIRPVPMLLPIAPRQLNRPLIGLRAAVADKDLVQATVLHQNLGQLKLRYGIELI